MVKRIVVLLIAVCLFTVPVSAKDELYCADEYEDMLDALPEDVAELLPDKLFSTDISEIGEGAKEAISFGYILGIVAEELGFGIKKALKLLAGLLGLLILSALMNAARTSFSSKGISNAFSILTSCAVFLTAFAAEYAIVKSVAIFFERICTLANSLLPLTAALYAMGGNVAGAVVHHSSLMVFITIIHNLCAKCAMPISGVCMALASVSAISPEINILSISAFFKKTYTQTMIFIMTVFVTVMGAQSLLAGKTDTLAGKAVKFAVSNLIPTIGAALSGTLGTVATSVEYIRASVGVIGIVAVILMLAPTLVTLLLTKFVFSLLEGAADILGCTSEKKILTELAGINGFFVSLTAITSVCLIFIIGIFAKCSSAGGGGTL